MNKTTKFVELINAEGIKPQSIFDVGAFDCAESIALAQAFPNAQVYAFEPVPRLLSHADDVIRPYPNIHLMPFALAHKSGLRTFNESAGHNLECGSLLEPNGQYFELMPTREIVVPAFSIADVIAQCPQIRPPEVMWMDVQGNETDVLKGMGNFIKHLKLLWAEVTYTPYYHGQMCVSEFDHTLVMLGYEKIYEEIGIKDWFGNACYRRKSGI